MMPTLTKRLTATATIRSKIETDITTISSFALIPAQSINGTQLKIHRTTPIPTDIVNFPEKSFFFSLTMPSTPYSVSISSLPRNSYLEDSLPLKINRNTATATITRSIATPIPLAKSSVIPILLLSLKPISTCAEEGHKTYTCKVCGETKTETIAKVDHKYELTNTVEATCDAEGYKEYTCSVCGDVKRETIKKLDHEYELTNTVEPTCQHEGYKEYTCKNCGDVVKKAPQRIKQAVTENLSAIFNIFSDKTDSSYICC